MPFLGEVPLTMAIREKSDAGTPVVAADPDSVHARIYKDIATRLADQLKARAANRPGHALDRLRIGRQLPPPVRPAAGRTEDRLICTRFWAI